MLAQMTAQRQAAASVPKAGAFRNWTEDEQAAEIVLPMTGISKNLIQFSLGSSESVAVTNKAMRSAQKLVVKNKMTGETLLLADPPGTHWRLWMWCGGGLLRSIGSNDLVRIRTSCFVTSPHD